MRFTQPNERAEIRNGYLVRYMRIDVFAQLALLPWQQSPPSNPFAGMRVLQQRGCAGQRGRFAHRSLLPEMKVICAFLGLMRAKVGRAR